MLLIFEHGSCCPMIAHTTSISPTCIIMTVLRLIIEFIQCSPPLIDNIDYVTCYVVYIIYAPLHITMSNIPVY